MTTVHFSSHQCHISDLVDENEAILTPFRAVNGLSHANLLPAGHAYTLDLDRPDARAIISTLNMQPPASRAALMNMAATQGPTLHRDMAFWERYLTAENLGLVQVAISTGSGAEGINAKQQLNGFQRALLEYQNALLALQQSAPGMPGAGARQAQATRRIYAAYSALEQQYGRTLAELAPANLRHSNRGTALSNANRGILLARRSQNRRADPRIHVSDMHTAHRLSRYARHIQNAGHAAMVLDVALRSGKVNTVREAGGNWHRESAVQLSGFAVGAIGGTAAAIAMKGATVAIMASPVGWAMLGVLAATLVLGVYLGSAAGAMVGEALGGVLYDNFNLIAP